MPYGVSTYGVSTYEAIDFPTRTINLAQRSGVDFSDNFNDNSLSAAWSIGGTNVAEVNQQLEIGPVTAVYGSASVSNLDLANRAVYVKSVANATLDSVAAGSGIEQGFYLRNNFDENNKFAWWSESSGSAGNSGRSMYEMTTIASVTAQYDIVTLDAALQTARTWLRLSTYSGFLVWEYAPDASGVPGTWVVQKTLAIPPSFTPSNMDLVFNTGYWSTTAPTTPGTSKWDNLNTISVAPNPPQRAVVTPPISVIGAANR